jgi:hypothetical protein
MCQNEDCNNVFSVPGDLNGETIQCKCGEHPAANFTVMVGLRPARNQSKALGKVVKTQVTPPAPKARKPKARKRTTGMTAQDIVNALTGDDSEVVSAVKFVFPYMCKRTRKDGTPNPHFPTRVPSVWARGKLFGGDETAVKWVKKMGVLAVIRGFELSDKQVSWTRGYLLEHAGELATALNELA